MRRGLWLLWVILLFGRPAGAAGVEPRCDWVDGWSAKGAVYHYLPDNLFDYMNGNSEGYFIFGFEELTGVACVQGDNRIVIDLSRMGSDEMAFGIFTTNRHPRFEVEKIGAQGQVMPRRATFAKGRYYVELTASGARDQRAALEAFARKLEAMIPGGTELPAALAWFPTEGLEAGSVRLVPQSVMGLALLKRGYVAHYPFGRAFIVTEESAGQAAEVFAALRARLGETRPITVGDEGLAGSDRYLGPVVAGRQGRVIAGFVEFSPEEDAVRKIAGLLAGVH